MGAWIQSVQNYCLFGLGHLTVTQSYKNRQRIGNKGGFVIVIHRFLPSFQRFSIEDALYSLTTHVFPLKLSSSLLALQKTIRKPFSAKALSWMSKVASLLIDHSLFSIFNFSIKTFAELLSLFRISFPSFIVSITDKLLGMKDFFSIALFSKLFAFFIGEGRVHDSEALSLFLIDAGVVKRMNIKFKLGNWSKHVHVVSCSEANTSQFRFSLKCWI